MAPPWNRARRLSRLCHYPVHRVGSRGSENKCLSSLRPSLVLPTGTRTRPPTPPPVSDAGLTGVQGVADRGKARWEGALVHQDLDIGHHIFLRILREEGEDTATVMLQQEQRPWRRAPQMDGGVG